MKLSDELEADIACGEPVIRAAVRERFFRMLRPETVKIRLPDLRPYVPDPADSHVYGGGLLIAVGAWMAYPPAGFVVFGALLLYLGLKVPSGAKRRSD